MADDGSCRGCGARLRAGDTWCALCFAPVVAEAVAEAVAPFGRPVPAAPAPRAPARYSRWHGGPTTLGPRWRVLLTVATLLVPVFMLYAGGLFALAFVFLWLFVGMPLVLRDVWSRGPVG